MLSRCLETRRSRAITTRPALSSNSDISSSWSFSTFGKQNIFFILIFRTSIRHSVKDYLTGWQSRRPWTWGMIWSCVTTLELNSTWPPPQSPPWWPSAGPLSSSHGSSMLFFTWYDNIICYLSCFELKTIYSKTSCFVDPSLWSGHGAQQVQGQALHPCSGEEEENPGVKGG